MVDFFVLVFRFAHHRHLLPPPFPLSPLPLTSPSLLLLLHSMPTLLPLPPPPFRLHPPSPPLPPPPTALHSLTSLVSPSPSSSSTSYSLLHHLPITFLHFICLPLQNLFIPSCSLTCTSASSSSSYSLLFLPFSTSSFLSSRPPPFAKLLHCVIRL